MLRITEDLWDDISGKYAPNIRSCKDLGMNQARSVQGAQTSATMNSGNRPINGRECGFTNVRKSPKAGLYTRPKKNAMLSGTTTTRHGEEHTTLDASFRGVGTPNTCGRYAPYTPVDRRAIMWTTSSRFGESIQSRRNTLSAASMCRGIFNICPERRISASGLGSYHTKAPWPFPQWPNPLDRKDGRVPRFNPDNYEDAPL